MKSFCRFAAWLLLTLAKARVIAENVRVAQLVFWTIF